MHKCSSKAPLLACAIVSDLLKLLFLHLLSIMLFFLVSCLSFVLLSQSFLPPKMGSRAWRFFREILVLLTKKRKIFVRVFQVPSIKKILILEEEKEGVSLFDLPDLVLECILERLSPADLCSMGGVSSWMREKCRSDHLWEKLMKQKWGEVIGDAAYREWQSQIGGSKRRTSPLPPNSVMSFYLALQTGKFWFPAQVFNRENGHVGFMLSCYDALLSYDSITDNFVARYKAQGRSMIEEGIPWERIRAPIPADHVLHISCCLHHLQPHDHIEIQWRKNKDFPYGWWYGVVGHLDSCSGNEFNCHCHLSDTIVLEFKQYSVGSRWRKAKISRKSHREIGSEVDGFYGGIRKLSKKEEIQKWKQLWPKCTLE